MAIRLTAGLKFGASRSPAALMGGAVAPSNHEGSIGPDPLGHREPLPLVERFFPLGFPAILRTNSSEVIAAATESWGEFVAAFGTAPVELRVIVRGNDAELPGFSPEGPVFRAQGHLLALSLGRENYAVCDLDRGFGFAYLTPAVARNHLFTSFQFLDCMAYTCLAQRYATPIHAACVARNCNGILLVGGPGAGKSSLAWKCARNGLAYLCDDATWLLRGAVPPAQPASPKASACPEPALIGNSKRVRFRRDAPQLIPELAQAPRIETVIGKQSFEVRTADLPGLVTVSRCRPWKIVFLSRQPDGPAEFFPVNPDEVRRRLAAARMMYEHRVWMEQEVSIDRLVCCDALELRYSSLAAAADHILKLE